MLVDPLLTFATSNMQLSLKLKPEATKLVIVMLAKLLLLLPSFQEKDDTQRFF